MARTCDAAYLSGESKHKPHKPGSPCVALHSNILHASVSWLSTQFPIFSDNCSLLFSPPILRSPEVPQVESTMVGSCPTDWGTRVCGLLSNNICVAHGVERPGCRPLFDFGLFPHSQNVEVYGFRAHSVGGNPHILSPVSLDLLGRT